jgi:hypothetical protein
MAGKDSISGPELEILRFRIRDIAGQCDILRDLGIRVVDLGDDDSAVLGVAIRTMSEHAGALADSCAVIAGGEAWTGDFINWRMSPLERDEVEMAKEISHG